MSDTNTTLDTKPWYQSSGVWGSVVTIGAGIVAVLFHRQIDADTQTAIVSWLAAGGALVGGAISLWGRLKATKKIG